MSALIAGGCSAAEQLRVEDALTAHYLNADGAFGAGALRYLDASEAQLRAALGVAHDGNPLEYLAWACGGASAMADALARGLVPYKPKPGLPGFFRYLVMTCAIVATADSNDSTQEFVTNLAEAFDCRNPFNNRSALPILWQRLARWCNEENAAGRAIRSVVLPPPGTGKHLGITNAITFPSWRDLRRLRQLLDRRMEYRSIVDPVDAAIQLCPLIGSDETYSPAIRLASAEYRQLYLKKASLLGLHRFWVALAGLLAEHRPSACERITAPRLELRFGGTLDDIELCVACVDKDGRDTEPPMYLEGSPDDVMAKARSWTAQRIGGKPSEPLLSALSNGIVPLTEASFGVWHSSLVVPTPHARCLLLLTRKNKDIARRWGVSAESIGDNWMVAGPIPVRDCRSVYQYLGLNVESHWSAARAMTLVGGYKTGNGFLGRQSLLPQIGISGPGTVMLRPSRDDGVKCQLLPESSGIYSICAETSLEGAYKLRLDEDMVPTAESLAIETSISFFPDALEHAALSEIDGAQWRHLDEASGPASRERAVKSSDSSVHQPLYSNERSERFQDLLEAFYAGGRTGWSEQELVSTIVAILGSDTPSVWDILHGLLECGWLKQTFNRKWRAHRWWLTPPSLIRVASAEGVQGLLLTGSAPENIRRRFRETVLSADCSIEERVGPSEYAVSMLVARGTALGDVAKELGWPVCEARAVIPLAAPNCWPREAVDEARHQRAASWNWETGCFQSPATTTSWPVNLERFRRERGDKDDIFVVSNADKQSRYLTTSRTSAISEAYRRARIAMFSWDGCRLIRNCRDGHLVEPLASLAMLSSCQSPGPALVDGRWTYGYDMSSECIEWIRSVFGAAFIDCTSSHMSQANFLSEQVIGWSRNRNVFRVRELTPLHLGGRTK